MLSLREKGQGLTEYALILSLVTVVVVIIVSLFGIQVGTAFEEVHCNLDGRTEGFGAGKIVMEVVEGSNGGDYKCVFYNRHADGSYHKGRSWNVWDSDGDGD
jgi:pilus assembly protein Flp/PilA